MSSWLLVVRYVLHHHPLITKPQLVHLRNCWTFCQRRFTKFTKIYENIWDDNACNFKIKRFGWKETTGSCLYMMKHIMGNQESVWYHGYTDFRKFGIYENLYCDDIQQIRTFPYGFIMYKHDPVVSFHPNLFILKLQAFPSFLFSLIFVNFLKPGWQKVERCISNIDYHFLCIEWWSTTYLTTSTQHGIWGTISGRFPSHIRYHLDENWRK